MYVLHLFSIFLLPGLDSPVGHSFSRSAPSSYPWRETQTQTCSAMSLDSASLLLHHLCATKQNSKERERGGRERSRDGSLPYRARSAMSGLGRRSLVVAATAASFPSLLLLLPPLFTRAKYHQSLHQHTHGRVKRLDPAGFPSQRNKKRKHKKRKRRRPNSIGNVWADLSHSVT